MANLIEQAKQNADELLRSAYLSAASRGELPADATLSGTVEPESLRRWTNGMEFAMTALFIVILCDWAKGAIRRAK